jgi:arylsulfatase A-like enzyme
VRERLRDARLVSHGLVVAILAAIFFLGAWMTSPAEYGMVAAGFLLLLYVVLAGALHLAVLGLLGVARALGFLAAISTAAMVFWHLREQFGSSFLRPPVFAVATLVLGGVHFAFSRGTRGAARDLRPLMAAVALSAVFVTLVVAGYRGSNTLRWHLLRHNKLVGTPAYFLLSEPVKEIRRELWATHQAGDAGLSVSPGPERAPAADPPDIVFVLLDTLRADALAAYGGDPSLMPGLNRFAAESVVFRDVMANATWTRPSVASFFTGLPQEQHAAVDRDDRLPDPATTLAERLVRSGYETAGFVANFAAVGRDAGFAQGFQHFVQLEGGADPYARARDVGDAVRAWLHRRPRSPERPLFLYVHYLDPHTPYLSSGGEGAAAPLDARSAYDAELRYVDAELVPLLRQLRERLGRDAIVFVTSDHGEEFGEHGEGGHGHSLYPEVLDLPAFLNGVSGAPGIVDARLEARDFFDLLLRLVSDPDLDVRQWAQTRHRSVRYASIYSTTDSAPHRPYLHDVCMRGREEDGRFLIWSAYGPTVELYDRSADPFLTRNLEADRPEQAAEMLGRLGETLPTWSRRVSVEHSDETEALLRRLGYVE